MPAEPPQERPPARRRPSATAAKGKAQSALRAAHKAAGKARGPHHPKRLEHAHQADAGAGSGSHLPDLPLSELLASSGPPGGSQPPATYVPPGSSVGWLHGVGQAITPGPAMANTALYLREAAGRAKAKSGAAWNYCYHTHTTIPKRS